MTSPRRFLAYCVAKAGRATGDSVVPLGTRPSPEGGTPLSPFFGNPFMLTSGGLADERAGEGRRMQSSALVVEDQDLMRQVLMVELKSVLKDGVLHAAGTSTKARRRYLASTISTGCSSTLVCPVSANVEVGRLTVVEEIIESVPQAIHIVITGSDSKAEALACQKLGANAYVSKVGLDRNCLRKIISESYPKPTSTCRNRGAKPSTGVFVSRL